MKRVPALIGVLLLVCVAVGAGWLAWHRYGPREVPAGQPPLATLGEENLSAFKARFNQAAWKPRLLVMLSPT